MLLLVASVEAGEPFRSVNTLVSANGYGSLVYDTDRLTQGWDHLYQSLEEYEDSSDLLYDTYFGYTQMGSTGGWLIVPEEVWQEAGTGILVSTQTVGELEFTQYAFMPTTYAGWGVAQVMRVRNASTTARSSAFQLASLHNWKPGGSEETATYDAERVVERGSSVALWYRAPGANEATCEGIYDTVLAGRPVAGDCGGYSSDAVPGFGWAVASLGPGEEAWFGVFTATEGDPDWPLLDEPAQSWLLAEYDAWSSFQAKVVVPGGLRADEEEVYRQQVAFLAMAQVREPGSTYGQIPASYPVAAPPSEFAHTWNITWVRDTAYAAVALARAGFPTEAGDALKFAFQEGKAGQYPSYVNGQDYGLSVCRLYGDGTEWSDDDGTGPNIELDNWGIWLWALGEVAAEAGDGSLVDGVGLRALDEIADPLVGMIVPANGLIAVDSSIWERHFSGGQRQYMYTQVMAVAGLRAAGDLADELGDPRGDGYRAAADGIAAAIRELLVSDGGVLAGSVAELLGGSDYLDIAAVEAYNFDVIDPTGSTFGPTLAAWEAALKVESGVGYRRNDDGSSYDEQEWAFADLRLSPALRRACATAQAEELEDWITGQAMANDRQIPELFVAETGEYAGPVPMLGFGAGLYLLAMQSREADGALCPEVVPPVFDEPVEATYTPPCAVVDAVGAGAAGMLFAVVGVVRRRRSRRSASATKA